MSIHSADWSQILNDTKESLEKVSRNQCKLTMFQFTSIPSTIPPVPAANVVWGLKIHSKPWSLQLLVYELYFHGNLKMRKSSIQLQRSASLKSCINRVNSSQRGLHQVGMRKITFNKKKLETFFSQNWGERGRAITLLFLNKLLKTCEKCG